jgi:hypothetical protein
VGGVLSLRLIAPAFQVSFSWVGLFQSFAFAFDVGVVAELGGDGSPECGVDLVQPAEHGGHDVGFSAVWSWSHEGVGEQFGEDVEGTGMAATNDGGALPEGGGVGLAAE